MIPITLTSESNHHSFMALRNYLGKQAPQNLTAIGNTDVLQNKSLAIFCSSKCPGNMILKTYDLMRQVRGKGITVISGFHSAMEQECLAILLKGNQPIIVCPARNIVGMRIKSAYKKPLEDGRLLLLSPFSEKENRISSDRALRRNYFVAALAEDIFIPYAAPKSKTERFRHELLKWGKRIYTMADAKNGNLLNKGISPVTTAISNTKLT